MTSEQTKQFYASSDGCPIFQQLYEASPSFQLFIKNYMKVHSDAFPYEYEELVSMSVTMKIHPEYAFIQNGCSELALMFGSEPIITSTPEFINTPPIYTSMPVTSQKKQIQSLRNQQRREHCSDIGLIFTESVDSNNTNANKIVRVVQGHNEDWWSTVADKMSIIHTPEW